MPWRARSCSSTTAPRNRPAPQLRAPAPRRTARTGDPPAQRASAWRCALHRTPAKRSRTRAPWRLCNARALPAPRHGAKPRRGRPRRRHTRWRDGARAERSRNRAGGSGAPARARHTTGNRRNARTQRSRLRRTRTGERLRGARRRTALCLHRTPAKRSTARLRLRKAQPRRRLEAAGSRARADRHRACGVRNAGT